MIVKCLECLLIHQFNSWIYLGSHYILQKERPQSIYEVHITCFCGNRLTVEKEVFKNSENNEISEISLMLGCEAIYSIETTPHYIHNKEQIENHYYTGLKYDSWGNMNILEDAYY